MRGVSKSVVASHFLLLRMKAYNRSRHELPSSLDLLGFHEIWICPFSSSCYDHLDLLPTCSKLTRHQCNVHVPGDGVVALAAGRGEKLLLIVRNVRCSVRHQLIQVAERVVDVVRCQPVDTISCCVVHQVVAVSVPTMLKRRIMKESTRGWTTQSSHDRFVRALEF